MVNGEYPNVFTCLKCGKEKEIMYFHVPGGGTLCESCAGSVAHTRRLDQSTLYTLQYIITEKIEKLYTFKVSEEVLNNLEQVMDEYMAYYIDRKFHALQVLEENQGFASGFLNQRLQ